MDEKGDVKQDLDTPLGQGPANYVVDVHDNHGNDDTYGINDNGADVEDNVHAHGDFDTDAKVDDCDDKLWRWC